MGRVIIWNAHKARLCINLPDIDPIVELEMGSRILPIVRELGGNTCNPPLL